MNSKGSGKFWQNYLFKKTTKWYYASLISLRNSSNSIILEVKRQIKPWTIWRPPTLSEIPEYISTRCPSPTSVSCDLIAGFCSFGKQKKKKRWYLCRTNRTKFCHYIWTEKVMWRLILGNLYYLPFDSIHGICSDQFFVTNSTSCRLHYQYYVHVIRV